jgi:hypothetical protein
MFLAIFFRVLGVQPALGRDFRLDEDQADGRDAVVVLGHDFWVSQFGGRVSAIGSHIRLNGVELSVIGVAPEHFTGIDTVLRPQVFVPLHMSARTEQQNPRGVQKMNTLNFAISDGYFETMDIPILRGRGFRESDGENAPVVAVVNEQMANHYWKGEALGKRFHMGMGDGPLVEIVGIARMSKYWWIGEAPRDLFYLSYRQHAHATMTLVAESEATDAATLAAVVR